MPPTLGTLPLQSAHDRLDLVAAPVAQSFNHLLHARAFVVEIDPGLADTAALAEAYDLPLSASANCVIVLGRRGGEPRPAGCVLLADTRLDVNNVVRRRLDVRKCSFAPQDFATEQTSMEYGGITPIGLPPRWPVLVDTRVAETEWVVVGSGLRRSKLVIPGIALASLPGSAIVDGLAT